MCIVCALYAYHIWTRYKLYVLRAYYKVWIYIHSYPMFV